MLVTGTFHTEPLRNSTFQVDGESHGGAMGLGGKRTRAGTRSKRTTYKLSFHLILDVDCIGVLYTLLAFPLTNPSCAILDATWQAAFRLIRLIKKGTWAMLEGTDIIPQI